MIKIEFQAMGCRIAAFLDNEGHQAADALRQVPAWFEEWEQILSRFRPDSDLNRLNQSAGTAVQVEPILLEVIQEALKSARWTGGLVAPTVLNSLVQAGYDRSFDLMQSGYASQPGGAQTILKEEYASEANYWGNIDVDERKQSIKLPAGARLDLGGIGKGWAAQKAVERLAEYGPALVDAGGDIAVSDVQADGSPWPVAVADPLQVQERLDLLALGRCGVATSGIDYRRWYKDGAWKHHIIDPRTGEPAMTDLMSVTIIAPDAIQAEAAAKSVLIQGSQAGLDWLENQPHLSGLLALQDGHLTYSHDIDQYLWSSYGS